MSDIQDAARAVAARDLRQRARELADIHDRPLAMSSPLTPGQHAAIADYLQDTVDTSDVLRLMDEEIALLEHRLADAQALLDPADLALLRQEVAEARASVERGAAPSPQHPRKPWCRLFDPWGLVAGACSVLATIGVIQAVSWLVR